MPPSVITMRYLIVHAMHWCECTPFFLFTVKDGLCSLLNKGECPAMIGTITVKLYSASRSNTEQEF